MAPNSFITDFGKRPPAVKLGVFLAILVVAGGLYYQLVFSGMSKDIQAAKDSAGALVADEQKLTLEEKEYTRLREKQDVLETMIKENDTALPTAAQLPSFFDMLNRKVGEAGVDVLEWTYLKELQVEETIFKVPVQITLQGTFHELKKFFHLLYKMNEGDGEAGDDPTPDSANEVEERDRILTIEDLHIRSPEMKNNELLLTATFRASTFRKEAPAVEIPSEADKKKAKKAADKGAAGNNPVQKAKAKTEDAMEKSDDRAKKAGGDDSPVKEGN